MLQKPNILIVVVDCARSDKWLGPARTARTPNLDRLCTQSTVLPTTITEKSCTTPSFATLLTGRYSPRHGVHLVWGYRLPEQVPLLPDLLRAEGYHAYAEVSGPLLPEMGLQRGFDHYAYRAPSDYLHTAWGRLLHERLRTGHYRAPWFLLLHLWELHPHRQVHPECDNPDHGNNCYERAVSSLDMQLADLFAAAGDDTLIVFTGDHGEKTTEENYHPGTAVAYARDLLRVDQADGLLPYQVASWAGPSVLQQLYGQCTPMMRGVRLRDRIPAPVSAWSKMMDRLRLLKLTPLVFLHDLLALRAPLKLTRMLERRGLLDERRSRGKVQKFAAGLGRERLFDMHMRMWTNSYRRNLEDGHMVHVYDFLVRVPLVVRAPRLLPSGKIISRMVRQPDILPTVLDLLGAKALDELPHIDGRSFLPLLRGEAWEPLPAFLSVSGLPADLELRGVRTERYKYTYGPENPELPEELYDLEHDPREAANIASAHPELSAHMRDLADAFVNDAGGPLDEIAISASDEARVEKHLQELGYL